MEMSPTGRSNSNSSVARLNAGSSGPAAASDPPPTEGWIESREVLLVVVTLITTLTYTLTANPPGGFWQDDNDGHVAGEPILRDKARTVYFLLTIVNWLSFYNSLVLTVWLLSGVPAKSKQIKRSFLFSYTCLVFTYNVPLANGHISDPDVIITLVLAIITWICFFFFAKSNILS